jgi:hypothetical protein
MAGPFDTDDPRGTEMAKQYYLALIEQYAPHYRVVWYHKPTRTLTETWHVLGADDDDVADVGSLIEERAWEALTAMLARQNIPLDVTEWVLAKRYIKNGN